MSEEIWQELADTMRRIRRAHDTSLRRLEASSRWGRGTLSLVETAKIKPSPDLVAEYDSHFGGHGMVAALYNQAQANTAEQRIPATSRRERMVPGDVVELLQNTPAVGERVELCTELTATWTVRNAGSVPWRGRALVRLGPPGGARLITSAPVTQVPTTLPGETVQISMALVAPATVGTAIAYWRMVDADGDFCQRSLLSTVLIL